MLICWLSFKCQCVCKKDRSKWAPNSWFYLFSLDMQDLFFRHGTLNKVPEFLFWVEVVKESFLGGSGFSTDIVSLNRLCLEIFSPITENLPLSHEFFSGHRVYYFYTFGFSKICSSDVWSVWGRICWWILEMKELVTGSNTNSCDPKHTWITFKLCISTTANSGQWACSMHGWYFHSVFSLFLSVAPTIASPLGLTIQLPKPSPGFITRHAVSTCVEAAEVLLQYWTPQREFDAPSQIILVFGRRLMIGVCPISVQELSYRTCMPEVVFLSDFKTNFELTQPQHHGK